MVRHDDSNPQARELFLVGNRSYSTMAFLQNAVGDLDVVLVPVMNVGDALSRYQPHVCVGMVVSGESAETLATLRLLQQVAAPVFVLVGGATAEDFINDAYEAGAADVLREPWSSVALKARVRAAQRLLRASRAHPAESAPRTAPLPPDFRPRHDFLAMLGHELRNPLAPLSNAVQVLRQTGTRGAMAEQTLDLIDRQLRHLTRLVNDLLDVSRITRGTITLHPEVVDMNTVVHQAAEAARLLFAERHLHLTFDRAGEALPILADPTRLQQILDNLLVNAARYTEPGGRVWLEVEGDAYQVVVRVRDTGIGIRPELQQKIFDLFAQGDRAPDRPQEGLGIGLTLVHRLVEMHHGSIEVSSGGLGHGSEFTLRFPRVVPAAGVPTATGASTMIPNERLLRILVVEDNKDTARSLAGVLRLWGHEVCIAYDGHAALEAARAFQPEVVFLDIGLPQNMDGYEVALRLREQPEMEKACIVAVTGFGQPEDQRRAMKAGFDAHLTKPVPADDLRRLLAEISSGVLGGRAV
jgi:signal transduction histidine kinase/ActR/RegA family two-component response regulator